MGLTPSLYGNVHTFFNPSLINQSFLKSLFVKLWAYLRTRVLLVIKYKFNTSNDNVPEYQTHKNNFVLTQRYIDPLFLH